jgi:ribosomal subunit interface protein
MKINVKTTNITLTPSISDYIEKKLAMLEKFFEGREVLISMEVGKTTKHHRSGDFFRAEIHLTAGSEDYYSVSETSDLYASIDEVKDEIVQIITSKRNKSMSLVRRGGAQIKNILKGIAGASGRGWKRIRRKK